MTDSVLREVSMTRSEYNQITSLLGRPPNSVELGMFGALWSEHCGYQHSRPLLKTLPAEGDRILVGAGEENAGAVDIGDGLAVVFKIESHNHPSAVEPFEGAATGVGGIIRDIFTMGARPIALLDSLRFGDLTNPRNRYLAKAVIGGIGHYGNCVGVPTVGGEFVIDSSYEGNPLVNAMCVGILPHSRITRAVASGKGNPVILVGADTGRDGVHGATFASLENPQESARGVVQVGNPFLEKLLIESCLEALGSGAVVGLQDLGAAGLTSSAVEAADRSGSGIRLNLDSVSRRTTGLTPYEIMLSESQERMLVVAELGRETELLEIFDRWGLHCDIIGEVTDDGDIVVISEQKEEARIPITHLTNAPTYEYPVSRPDYIDQVQNFDPCLVTEPTSLKQCALDLLGSPNIASKLCIYQSYDQTVGSNTVIPCGSDAAVLRIKNTRRGIALSTDGNSRMVFLNPRVGAAMAVAEAARNVICTGALPIAATNCLNFGSPTVPSVYFQLVESVKGIGDACRELDTPITGGNVSLYNESGDQQIQPTPIIGMLGLLDDIEKRCNFGFVTEGDHIAVLGTIHGKLDGSEYLKIAHGVIAGNPELDLAFEKRLQSACLELISEGLLSSAHDISEGGLTVCVAESAIAGQLGVALDVNATGVRADELWFGEGPSRIVVSYKPEHLGRISTITDKHEVSATEIGITGGKTLKFADDFSFCLEELTTIWNKGLETALSGETSGD